MNFRDKKEEIRNWIKNNVKGEDYILIGKDTIVLTGFLDSGRVEHAEISKDLKFQIILDTEEPFFEITSEECLFIVDLIKYLKELGF